MGCDIHLRVQGFRDGAWEYVKTKPFLRYDEPGFTWADDPTGRNYWVFAALADVRNDVGPTRIEPWFPARGFPDGLTEEDMNLPCPEDYDEEEWAEKYPTLDRNAAALDYENFTGGDTWLGEHSFTWATLAELQAADWDVSVRGQGVVSSDQFREWRDNGYPTSWSMSVGMGDLSVTTPAHMELLVSWGPTWTWALEKETTVVEGQVVTGAEYAAWKRGVALPDRRSLHRQSGSVYTPEAYHKHVDDGRAFTVVEWDRKAIKGCAFERWVFGETMKALADEYGGPQNVRVLMGFDS